MGLRLGASHPRSAAPLQSSVVQGALGAFDALTSCSKASATLGGHKRPSLTYLYARMCMHVCVCTYVYARMCVHACYVLHCVRCLAPSLSPYSCMYAYTCVHICVHIYLILCKVTVHSLCTNVRTRMYACMYENAYIPIYAHASLSEYT